MPATRDNVANAPIAAALTTENPQPVPAPAPTPVGPPPMTQVGLAGGVALSAGIIATILFFQATGMVRDKPAALGAAEAMQAAELLFAMALGALFLGEAWPLGIAAWGAALVVAGICAFAWLVSRPHRAPIAQVVPAEPHA